MTLFVTPAKAGAYTQDYLQFLHEGLHFKDSLSCVWVPAFAGMTGGANVA